MCDLDQTCIVKLIDENDKSTLGHKAAELGNSELFKVINKSKQYIANKLN